MRYLILILTCCFAGLTLTCCFAGLPAHSQQLSFSLGNVPDSTTTIYMARYFGPKLYYADTTDMVKGNFSFDGSKHPGGLYAVVTPNGKYFQFIHDNEEIVMEIADQNNPVNSATIKKSENNKIFNAYVRFMTENKKEGARLKEDLEAVGDNEKKRQAIKDELSGINDKVIAYQKDIIKRHPNLFISNMIKMSMDIELPEHPRDENGTITDSNFVYHYYIKHYWDNFDLKDPRIVRTPMFHEKLDKYFSQKGVMQVPDTIMRYATLLLDQTDQVDQDNKVFQYIVHHVTNKYESSKIMGMDRVFWYMAKMYYCAPNEKAYWMTPENLKKVCERAEKVGRIMIGGQSIPIILPDSTEENWISSYDMKGDYTILYFWDPNCGHCKKVTPKLQTLYEKKFLERNVDIFAVGKATGEDFEKWKAYIHENNLTFTNVGLTKSVYNQATTDPTPLFNKTTLQSLNYSDTYDIYSTPRIFVLDSNKKILYKQITISQLEEIIDKLTGHESDEKLFPIEEEEDEESEDHEGHNH